jgi:hypothetical protein
VQVAKSSLLSHLLALFAYYIADQESPTSPITKIRSFEVVMLSTTCLLQRRGAPLAKRSPGSGSPIL